MPFSLAPTKIHELQWVLSLPLPLPLPLPLTIPPQFYKEYLQQFS